jgi:hypothetical protein
MAMQKNHTAEIVALHPSLTSWAIEPTGSMVDTKVGRGPLLGALFASSNPLTSGGPSTLYSLWMAEAMNRARNMCKLAMLLERHRWTESQTGVSYRAELACANQLTSNIRALEIKDDDAVLPCSPLMCEISSCLVALFRPALGQIILQAACERIFLLAYRRRALILAAMELVTQTLFNSFDRQGEGRLSVSIAPDRRGNAILLVEDSGSGLRFDTRASPRIVADLVGLLGGDIAYHRSAMGGTATKVRFPI